MNSHKHLFKDIKNDHLSGSIDIVDKARLWLKDIFLTKHEAFTALYTNLEEAAIQLVKAKPYMASLINLVDDLLHILKSTHSVSECVSYLDTMQNLSVTKFEAAASFHLNVKTVMTISFSRSVVTYLEALKRFQGRLMVYVCESRPLKEGELLAKHLQKKQIDIVYLVDAGSLSAIEHVDAIVLGADFIAKKGFSNKIGSLALALGANYFNKPLWVVADSSKYIPIKNPCLKDNHFPPADIGHECPFEVYNPYFEIIPNKLVTRVITPDGSFSIRNAKKSVFKKSFYNKSLLRHLMT